MKKVKAILLMAMCLLLFSGCMSGSNRVPSETPLPQITDFTEFHAAELRGGQPLPYVTRKSSLGFIIDEQNRLWSFGDNTTGLLGFGYKDLGIKIVIDQESGRFTVGYKKYPPTPIMDNVVDILFGDPSVGGMNKLALALKEDGTVWAWGESLSFEPVEIAHNIAAIYLQKDFFLLDADGTLFQYEGKVDMETYLIEYHLVKVMDDVKSFQSHAFLRFLFLKRDNSLWASGAALLLSDREQEMSDEPVKIMDNVRHFHQSSNHILVVTLDDRLYGWGSNSKGQLGNESIGEFIPSPHFIAEDVDKAYASAESSFFITLDKTLMAMGGNDHFQLGNASLTSTADPVVVLTDVVELYPYNPFLALTSSGTLLRWGIDFNKEADMRNIPTPQVFATEVLSFCPKSVFFHSSAYCLVKTDHTLWGWGWDPWITIQSPPERELAEVQPWTQLEFPPPSGEE